MNRLIAATFLVSTLMGAGFAHAMPLAPLVPASSADVIEVAGGCGPGWHRGPYGGCLPARLSHRPQWRLTRQRPLRCFRASSTNGSREENTSKQKDRTFGSDSIRTVGCGLFGHVTLLQHIVVPAKAGTPRVSAIALIASPCRS